MTVMKKLFYKSCWSTKGHINSNVNTHDWNNDKPYECGLETLDGGQAFYLPLFDFCQVY